MKRRLDMDRVAVKDRPELIYTANVPCVVTLWGLPNLEVEQDEKAEFSHIYLGFSLDAAVVEKGIPIPMDHPIAIPMVQGETLYASTTDYSYLGFIVTSEE